MPELAEVEQSRRIWTVGLNQKVLAVVIRRPGLRVFRGTDPSALTKGIVGKTLVSSEAHGKQLLFRFGRKGEAWLGLHLGMSGELRIEPRSFEPGKHDHLVLRQARRSLVLGDQRQFGRVLYHHGQEPPIWWSTLPPAILSPAFTEELVIKFLHRRKGAPVKAVLLMQERFPGIGNWMADEILWRSRIRPAKRTGSLSKDQAAALYRTTRRVCRLAIESIDANWDLPASWLFPHRWEDGGRCPRCGTGLRRAVIGGRRSCWCPSCQK